MAEHLSVDSAGLSAAAADSADIADALWDGVSNGAVTGSQPSQAAVWAFDTTLSAARARQSTRITRHADDLDAASALYSRTDDTAAVNITRTI